MKKKFEKPFPSYRARAHKTFKILTDYLKILKILQFLQVFSPLFKSRFLRDIVKNCELDFGKYSDKWWCHGQNFFLFLLVAFTNHSYATYSNGI